MELSTQQLQCSCCLELLRAILFVLPGLLGPACFVAILAFILVAFTLFYFISKNTYVLWKKSYLCSQLQAYLHYVFSDSFGTTQKESEVILAKSRQSNKALKKSTESATRPSSERVGLISWSGTSTTRRRSPFSQLSPL